MKLIIAGPRDYTNYNTLLTALKNFNYPITEIISGGATGVDLLGERYARENNIPLRIFPAKWDDLKAKGAIIKRNKVGRLYNVNAGFARNEEMAAYADALLAIKVGYTPGTADMISRAEKHNLLLCVYEVKDAASPVKK